MNINIPGLAAPITGSAPVVILGANGSGKTRLAVEMTRSVGAEFIPGLRNIALPDQIPRSQYPLIAAVLCELVLPTHIARPSSYS